MGLIARFKEKAKEVGTHIKDGVTRVWEGVKNVTKEVRDVARFAAGQVKDKINEWDKRYKEWKAKRQYIKGAKAEQHVVVDEKPDIDVKEKTKKLLDNTFHGKVEETLKVKTPAERIKCIEDFGKDLTKICGVEDVTVEVAYPADPVSMQCFGYYNDEEKKVYINAAVVECDHPRLVAEQVFTVIHEVNHARQWAIVRDYEKFGISPQKAWELMLNMRYYIRPEENDEAYRKQPVEAESYRMEEEMKEHCGVGPINK